jgi:predicted helicase
MDSIEWQELKPTEPMLFFTPRGTAGEAEWNAGFGIAELMKVNGMGVTTGDDSTLVGDDINLLLDAVLSKYNQAENKKVEAFLYRPFDIRFLYYESKLLARAREKFFEKCFSINSAPLRLCVKKQSVDNIALCLIKICSRDDDLPVFVTDKITDKTILSSKDNANVFPLYLYEENMGKVEKRANLDEDIVEKIAAILGLKNNSLRSSASLRLCVKNTTPSPHEELSPEDIFDYIYGVLHSPSYRTKFKEFLKVDFPRIPYPKDLGEFERFCVAGRELRTVHLMKDAEPSLFETHGRFPVAGDNVVDAVKWDNGRVYINSSQYFDNVPLEAWEQAIGGYRPAEKYLKDRKSRALSQEELKHYQRIILALTQTREIMDSLG